MAKPAPPTFVRDGLGLVGLGLFAVALFLAYLLKDEKLIYSMCGAAVVMANTVLNFYFGSSKGGQDQNQATAAQVERQGATLAAATVALANSAPASQPPPLPDGGAASDPANSFIVKERP